MWCFGSRKEIKACGEHLKEAEAALRAFRQVGETFVYLGRTCIVRGHMKLWPYLGWMPVLVADYVDETGVIHTITFEVRELPMLVNHNQPPGREG